MSMDEKKDRIIVYNAIRTPDGTLLRSKHIHDYVSYVDKNGKKYSVDGGMSYIKRSSTDNDFEELSLYLDDDIEILRNNLKRYNSKTKKHVLYKDIDDQWLSNIIEYCLEQIIESDDYKQGYNSVISICEREKAYRRDNRIKSILS